MRFLAFLLILAVVSPAPRALAAAGAAAPAAGEPAEGELVKEIRSRGQKSLDEQKVLAVVRQREGRPLSLSVANEDLKRIWKMGLFSDVKLKAEPIGKPGEGVRLIFEVAERPTVQELRFFGNKEFGDGHLKDKAALEEGSTYDQSKVAAAVKAIVDEYKDKNYYAVQVDVDAKPGKTPGQVVVNFRINEGNRMKIEQILITGNKMYSASKLKDQMEDTEEAGLIYGGAYDPAKLEKDLERVLRFYATEGYAKARLEGVSLDEFGDKGREVARKVTEFDEANKRIVIRFEMEEGRKYSMAGVSFSGASIYTEAELREKIFSDEDKVYNQEHWDADLAELRKAYAEKGYIYANVSPAFLYDEAQGELKIAVSITEGSKAFLEEIKIRGNDVTKDKVIRRVLTLKPGDPFDSEAISRDRMRIYNLGFFENVAVDTQPGSEMDKLVLIYDVSPERKTGTLSVGAGYSSVEGLVGFLQVSQNNLFGNGQAVSAQWDFGDRKNSYSLSFTEPWLFDRPVSLGTDIYRIFRTQAFNSQGFNQESTGGSLRLGYSFKDEWDRWKVFNTYRYQSDDTYDINQGVVQLTPGADGHIRENISSITPSLVRDSRDNIFDATRGSYNILSVTLAGGYLGADRHFQKPVFDSRFFFQTPAIFGQRWLNALVLGLHGRVGYVAPYFDDGRTIIPISEKFFMGGTDTVRGYDDRSLGASRSGGGAFTMLANVEYGFKPAPPLKLRAFYDSGNAWARYEDAKIGKEGGPAMYDSVGLGMLFTIPTSVIQIRLDWGWGLVPDQRSPNGRVHFNIGNIF